MAAQMIFVKGTRLRYGPDGVSWTTLADLVEIGSPPSAKRPKVDKTPLDPATSFREYSFGLAEAGEQKFKQLYLASREAALHAVEGVNQYWQILYPDATLDANKSHSDFQGTITEITKEALSSADARLVIDCTVTVTGAVTFTQGSGAI